jgi:hypothetical protein
MSSTATESLATWPVFLAAPRIELKSSKTDHFSAKTQGLVPAHEQISEKFQNVRVAYQDAHLRAMA